MSPDNQTPTTPTAPTIEGFTPEMLDRLLGNMSRYTALTFIRAMYAKYPYRPCGQAVTRGHAQVILPYAVAQRDVLVHRLNGTYPDEAARQKDAAWLETLQELIQLLEERIKT